jgi:hypothetical protein
MIPKEYRKKNLFQSQHFFRRFNEKKYDLTYIHLADFITDFYKVFEDLNKSFVFYDERKGERAGNLLCIYQKPNADEPFICVVLKDGEYYEMINVMLANQWHITRFHQKEQLRNE